MKDRWQLEREENERRAALYKALRKRDWDSAVEKAAPGRYLDYMRLKAEAGRASEPASIPAELSPESVKEQRELLCQLIEATPLDTIGRARLIERVFAASPTERGFAEIRRHIESYF